MDRRTERTARSHQCPECGSREVERSSRRGAYEHVVLRLLRQRPYRCLRCAQRFYDRRL